MPAKLLIESIQDTDNICKWNKTLTTSKVLKRLNDNVGITHQVRYDSREQGEVADLITTVIVRSRPPQPEDWSLPGTLSTSTRLPSRASPG